VIRLRGDPCGAPFRREPQLIFYRGVARCQTFERRAAGLRLRHLSSNAALTLGAPKPEACRPTRYPSSLAFIVMFALSTLDTGHPLLAFSAAF